MMSIKKVFLAILFSIVFVSPSYTQQTELVLVKSFPDLESEIEGDYLVRPSELELFKGLYIVSVPYEGCLKVFSKKGKFIKKIGSKGQGPGEMIDPYNFTFNKNEGTLYCIDRGNNRITIFTIEGEFLRVIKTFIPQRDIEYIGGNIFTAAYNSANKTLLTMYDISGVIKKTFGELFDEKLNDLKYSRHLYDTALDSYNGYLYVFYEQLPYIEIYTKNGELERRIEIKIKEITNRYKENIKGAERGVVNGMLYITRWFRGAHVDGNDLYFYSLVHSRSVIVLDAMGNLQRIIPFKEDVNKLDIYRFVGKNKDEFVFVDWNNGQVKIFKEIKRINVS